MKGYRNFIIIFSVLLVLYVLMEVYKPKPIDWSVTLSKDDKIPYGGYIIYQRLKDFFPAMPHRSFRTPLYDQVNNFNSNNTAYLILTPQFEPSGADLKEMKRYLSEGNHVFLSANEFAKNFLDTFQLKTDARITYGKQDSTSINFVNTSVKSPANYTFYRSTIDQYFSRIDTASTIVAGVNNHREANFIKIPVGNGALFVHANPICFSNYFLLHKDNASYAAKALSYIPANVSAIYWDEYYKLGRAGATTPLRFLLSNQYLRLALWLALAGIVLYVIFQMKRKQRIIPVIEPLKNSSLDFIKTVSGVYYNEKNNNSIADKKITYFFEFIRQRFNLATGVLDEQFTEQLSRKSGVEKQYVSELVALITNLPKQEINDKLLLLVNHKIDNFYKQV